MVSANRNGVFAENLTWGYKKSPEGEKEKGSYSINIFIF
jgi:hypothetical protein